MIIQALRITAATLMFVVSILTIAWGVSAWWLQHDVAFEPTVNAVKSDKSIDVETVGQNGEAVGGTLGVKADH